MADYCLYPAGFRRRKIITPQITNMDAALTDFSLLVPFTNDAAIGKYGHANGTNLRFAKPDGSLLKYERLSHVVASGLATGIYYVKRSLDPTGDNRIQCLYDNPGAAEGQDKVNTWRSEYKGVWHLNETSDGVNPSNAIDSTSNANTLTDNNTVGTGTGIIGAARDFEKDNSEGFTRADNASLSGDARSFSVQALIKVEVVQEDSMILGKWSTTFDYTLGIDSGNMIFAVSKPDTSFGAIVNCGAPVVGTTYLLRAWHDEVNDVIGISKNNDAPVTTAYTAGVIRTAALFEIGSRADATNYWDGLIYEARKVDLILSAAWKKFEYLNITEADNELTWGAEEVMSAGGMMGGM